jgi:hypothetical protein
VTDVRRVMGPSPGSVIRVSRAGTRSDSPISRVEREEARGVSIRAFVVRHDHRCRCRAGPVGTAAALAGGLDKFNVNYELEEQRS